MSGFQCSVELNEELKIGKIKIGKILAMLETILQWSYRSKRNVSRLPFGKLVQIVFQKATY